MLAFGLSQVQEEKETGVSLQGRFFN